MDFDDLDYGANFALLNARRATLDGICCDNSTQVFGLTSISRDFSNCTGFDTSEYIIKNSYFRNLQGENGISTGCRDAGEHAVRLTVADSVFVNAGRENEAVLRPHLANDKCRLYVFNCTFVDSRGNSRPAISVMGPGTNVEISDCTFEGFAGVWSSEPAIPTRAPDYILARECVTTTADPHRVIGEADFSALDALYEGTKAYYGDLHVHTDCGGTSDGSLPMSEWPAKMDEKKLDFAAVVDHRQMRGFFLLEWDEERFIIGTEPGTAILDLNACRHNHRSVHYNMLFPHKYGLAMVLANFPEFEFRGDELTGSFIYPKFTKERFFERPAMSSQLAELWYTHIPRLCSPLMTRLITTLANIPLLRPFTAITQPMPPLEITICGWRCWRLASVFMPREALTRTELSATARCQPFTPRKNRAAHFSVRCARATLQWGLSELKCA